MLLLTWSEKIRSCSSSFLLLQGKIINLLFLPVFRKKRFGFSASKKEKKSLFFSRIYTLEEEEGEEILGRLSFNRDPPFSPSSFAAPFSLLGKTVFASFFCCCAKGKKLLAVAIGGLVRPSEGYNLHLLCCLSFLIAFHSLKIYILFATFFSVF